MKMRLSETIEESVLPPITSPAAHRFWNAPPEVTTRSSLSTTTPAGLLSTVPWLSTA